MRRNTGNNNENIYHFKHLIMKPQLKKYFFALSLLLSAGLFSYGQRSFTSKQEALDWLRETFSKSFIKTTVYKQGDEKRISYNYEIGDNRMLIIKKTEGEISDARYTVPYEDISETFFLQKNDYFKSSTGIGFKPGYGESYVVSYGMEKKRFSENTAYATSAAFPFDIKKDDPVINSIINAINRISRENKASVKTDPILKDDNKNTMTTDDQKIKGTQLSPYKVFNSDNVEVNLYDYVEKNRQHKDKPVLLITWAHWCNICIKQIDTILKNGLGLKYDIILVNKGGSEAGFTKLKEKIRLHAPDYGTEAILLFDRNNQLEELDKNGAPFFLWMDKKLRIVGSFAGYAIKTETIISKLTGIE